MVGLCQSQRHHSCLIIVRISSSGESGKGRMYSRIRKAFSPDFLSQGLKEGLVVSLKRVRGLLTGLMKCGHAVFITSGDQVYRSWFVQSTCSTPTVVSAPVSAGRTILSHQRACPSDQFTLYPSVWQRLASRNTHTYPRPQYHTLPALMLDEMQVA